MGDIYTHGIQSRRCAVVFDLENADSDVFAELIKTSPNVVQAVCRLRSGVPVMSSAMPGIQGEFYRLKKHNRSICWSLSRDGNRASDVISLKGTEPLLPDFDNYVKWMSKKGFGNLRPITEHFPLREGKTPGCVYLSEAQGEAELALEVQKKHLLHYGSLAHLPTPVFVFRFPEQAEIDIISKLRDTMSAPAFERVEPYLARGIGIHAYYYPGPPVRAHAVGDPACFLKGQEILGTRQHVVDKAVPNWIQLFARLLWLGYLPLTPLAWRLGGIFDQNNACLDGGGCDAGTLFPMDQVNNDGFFGQSMFFALGTLRRSVSVALGMPMGDFAQSYQEAIVGSCLADSIRQALAIAVESNEARTLQLDARVATWVGSKSLQEYLEMFQTLSSYLVEVEYSENFVKSL